MAEALPVTGNTDRTAPENRVFYPALDGLRAVAFLLVFGQHYFSLPWGWTGVNVFFVLSGFLITGILLDTRDTPHRARNFYVRRTLRIFPLYYGVFLLLLFTTPLLNWRWTSLWIAWPLYLGNFLRYLSQAVLQPGGRWALAGDGELWSGRCHIPVYLGHFWSLCVEEQFYLLWPWVVFSIRSRRKLLWLCGCVIVCAPIARGLAQVYAPAWMNKEQFTYAFTPMQLDALLLGALLALLWRGGNRAWLLRAGFWIATLGLISAIAYAAFNVAVARSFFLYPYPDWARTWGMTYIDIVAAGAILCCIQPGNWLHAPLRLRPLRWLGRISYGAYVFHDIFHAFFEQLFLRSKSSFAVTHAKPLTALTAFGCTMVLAWASFRFYESRFLNLKERWTIVDDGAVRARGDLRP